MGPRPDRNALGVEGAGRVGVPVRGGRQVEPRLAAGSPTAAHLAAPSHRTAVDRPVDGRSVGRLRHELGGRFLRPDHRRMALVATHPRLGLPGGSRVSPVDLAAISADRRVSVADAGRGLAVLPARLAQAHSHACMDRVQGHPDGDRFRSPASYGAQMASLGRWRGYSNLSPGPVGRSPFAITPTPATCAGTRRATGFPGACC